MTLLSSACCYQRYGNDEHFMLHNQEHVGTAEPSLLVHWGGSIGLLGGAWYACCISE